MPLSFILLFIDNNIERILYCLRRGSVKFVMTIEENVKRIMRELPAGVQLVVAAKGREPGDVLSAVTAGINIIGENYIQEAGLLYKALGNWVKWHFIGHLQKNKVKTAVRLFDVIETVDSLELATEISRRSQNINKVMPVLIEIIAGVSRKNMAYSPKRPKH